MISKWLIMLMIQHHMSVVKITSVIKSLENAAEIVFTWFKNNQMKGNEDKCHVVLSTHEDMHVKIGISRIKNSCSEKLLGS